VSGQRASHQGTDFAGTDDAYRLAIQVEAEQAVQREIVFARAVVGAMDLTVERQDHADRELGYGVWRIGRDPGHLQPEPGRGGEVDIVEPGATQRHQPRAALRQQL
jgi:hypothetical protein